MLVRAVSGKTAESHLMELTVTQLALVGPGSALERGQRIEALLLPSALTDTERNSVYIAVGGALALFEGIEKAEPTIETVLQALADQLDDLYTSPFYDDEMLRRRDIAKHRHMLFIRRMGARKKSLEEQSRSAAAGVAAGATGKSRSAASGVAVGASSMSRSAEAARDMAATTSSCGELNLGH